MLPLVYVIDPGPDTVIVLKNPCTIFAPWNLEEAEEELAAAEARAKPNGYDRWGLSGVESRKKKKGKRRVMRKGHL
jgi:hypothetical protein